MTPITGLSQWTPETNVTALALQPPYNCMQAQQNGAINIQMSPAQHQTELDVKMSPSIIPVAVPALPQINTSFQTSSGFASPSPPSGTMSSSSSTSYPLPPNEYNSDYSASISPQSSAQADTVPKVEDYNVLSNDDFNDILALFGRDDGAGQRAP